MRNAKEILNLPVVVLEGGLEVGKVAIYSSSRDNIGFTDW